MTRHSFMSKSIDVLEKQDCILGIVSRYIIHLKNNLVHLVDFDDFKICCIFRTVSYPFCILSRPCRPSQRKFIHFMIFRTVIGRLHAFIRLWEI